MFLFFSLKKEVARPKIPIITVKKKKLHQTVNEHVKLKLSPTLIFMYTYM